jgi:hypothetical protein
VQAALNSLAKTTMQRFMDAMAGGQYTAEGLAKAAGNYQRAENKAGFGPLTANAAWLPRRRQRRAGHRDQSGRHYRGGTAT